MNTATRRWHRFLPKLSRSPTRTSVDARALAALAAVLFLVQFPHIFHLPVWVSILGCTLIGLRLWYHYHPDIKLLRVVLSPITITLIAASTAILLQFDFGYAFGRDPSVAFLFVLVAAKFAEIRRASDATLLLCLAAFLLLTQYFYSQTILAAVFTLPAIVALAFALSILRDSKNPTKNKQQVKLVSKLLLHGLPLAALLFFIFPRLPGPLWSLPEDAMATTGLSDSMSPGSIGSLSQSAAVAFRVEFDDEPPRANQLYWRGPVLTEFDGRNWNTSKTAAESMPQHLPGMGDLVSYTVMLQPHKQRWLFALDAAMSLPQTDSTNIDGQAIHTSTRLLGRLMGDGQMIANKPVSHVLRYRQSSVLSDKMASSRAPADNTLYLPGKNPRTIEFARKLRSSSTSDLDYAQNVLRNFNQDLFRYTLQPQLLGDAPVDEFLFQTKAGFCEHYAAAFVVLMRAADIPARVVTGYLGGEMNGDYMIVRQADAHAWAEAYIGGVWQRFDPTGYVAPSRVEQGLSAALPNETAVPGLARYDSGWLRSAQLRWDAMNHHWQRLVVDFNNDSQDKFWDRLGLLNPSLVQITLIVIALSLAWSLFILGMPSLSNRNLSPNEKLWNRLCRLLHSYHFTRLRNESSSEFLQRAALRWPTQRERLIRLDKDFTAVRFQRPNSDLSAVVRKRIQRQIALLGCGLSVSRFHRVLRRQPKAGSIDSTSKA
ncbi:MAG: DUF3488 and DUF4129 domain-containing transglutaminase family protein [Granulosicoccus sp.]